MLYFLRHLWNSDLDQELAGVFIGDVVCLTQIKTLLLSLFKITRAFASLYLFCINYKSLGIFIFILYKLHYSAHIYIFILYKLQNSTRIYIYSV